MPERPQTSQEAHGPAAEKRPDEWCVDCGHHVSVHRSVGGTKCGYWTDLCECSVFVSRSQALRYRAALEEIAEFVDSPGRPVLALMAREALRG